MDKVGLKDTSSPQYNIKAQAKIQLLFLSAAFRHLREKKKDSPFVDFGNDLIIRVADIRAFQNKKLVEYQKKDQDLLNVVLQLVIQWKHSLQ